MQILTSAETSGKKPVHFSLESSAVLQKLRVSVSEMLNSVPGSVRSTRDFQKYFGLDLKLSWQVMKLAGPGEALSLVPFVPTPGPMRRFLTAASTAGVQQELVEQIRTSYREFEEQVATHAGDRMTFESMALGSVRMQDGSDDDLRRTEVKHRKAGYQMHSHYCGAQVETYVSTFMLHPSSVAGQFDLAHLRSKLGHRRLRSGANFHVDTFKYTLGIDETKEQDQLQKESFDPESFAKYGAPIISRFSSSPLPQMRTVTSPDGKSSTSIVDDTLGQKSSVNLTFGRMIRNVPMARTPVGDRLCFGQKVSIAEPTVLVISDHLVHRPTFPRLEFKSWVEWMPLSTRIPINDTGPLPLREKLVRLEAGVDGARTREVPQYIDMLDFVCDRMGWRIDEFDVYRVRIEYPMLHTRIFSHFECP
jgi:hypothetical protein